MQRSNFNAEILKFIRDEPRSTVSLDCLFDKVMSTGDAGPRKFLASALSPSIVPSSVSRETFKRLLLTQLEQLEKIGIVHLEGSEEIQVKLSENFIELGEALGLRLTEIAKRTDKSLMVTPVFALPNTVGCDVCVIMPFLDEMKDVYSVIKGCGAKLNLCVERADEFFGASQVIQDIWSLINSAKVVVCDCTHKNPNVFYELGMAHTLGKDVILITQNEADVPFDLRQWRYIIYDTDSLAEKLIVSIRAILAK